MDYCKLNTLTYKDYYLLSLIGETLAWLAWAKVYTKLDIWQVFYWIRIDPSSEKLTMFHTCYSAYKCKVL
jgi:hypothetical protein